LKIEIKRPKDAGQSHEKMDTGSGGSGGKRRKKAGQHTPPEGRQRNEWASAEEIKKKPKPQLQTTPIGLGRRKPLNQSIDNHSGAFARSTQGQPRRPRLEKGLGGVNAIEPHPRKVKGGRVGDDKEKKKQVTTCLHLWPQKKRGGIDLPLKGNPSV